MDAVAPGVMRSMWPGDAEAVASLIRLAFGSIAVVLDPQPSALRETGESVGTHLRQGGGGVWDDEGVKGCVLWRDDGTGLYIGRLAVHPAWSGRGIARRLLAAAEAEAMERGLPRLHLSVRLALPGNRRLFASAGFRETAQHAHPGYAEPTFVDAEKLLSRP